MGCKSTIVTGNGKGSGTSTVARSQVPTGPFPEAFYCDHIARWSARSGTTGLSGTGVNTGVRLRTGSVPVPKMWCEHGLIMLYRVR